MQFHDGGPTADKTRLVKRVAAGVLFSATLGLAISAKRSKRKQMDEYFEGCQRLPTDADFTSGAGAELYCYKQCVFPASTIRSGTLKRLETFTTNPGDVIVASFPKSGTTWVQEMVYLIVTDLDFVGAQKQVLETRFPYLEYPFPGLAAISRVTDARMIKTHLPLALLPPSVAENGTKVIYIARNPKDVAVSYYHFLRMASFIGYKGQWQDFANKFLQGDVPYGPYFDHVLPYWNATKTNPDGHILWLSYEEMHKDPYESVRRIAKFLGRTLTDEQVHLIVEHTRFERMAANPAVNYAHWDDLGLRNPSESRFMRQGCVGDWRRFFDVDTERRFDEWAAGSAAGTGLAFDYVPTDDPNLTSSA